MKKVRENRRKGGRSSFETDHTYKPLENKWVFLSQQEFSLWNSMGTNASWLKCSYWLPWHSLTSEQQRHCSQSYSCKESFQNLAHCSLLFCCCCSSCRSAQHMRDVLCGTELSSLGKGDFEHISSPASLNCFTNGVPKCVAGACYLSLLQSGLGKTAFVFKFR